MKAIIIFLAMLTTPHAGWVPCPPTGMWVTVTLESQNPDIGQYDVKLPYATAIQDRGEIYTRHAREYNSYLRLSEASPCLGDFRLINEYGAKVISVDVDGIPVTLDPQVNNYLIPEWGT